MDQIQRVLSVVSNSDFITARVINWSYGRSSSRQAPRSPSPSTTSTFAAARRA